MIGKNLCLKFGLSVIYDHADFIIQSDDKVGVVGVNGCGKTTLFKVIMHDQELDEGKIEYSGLIGYLPQVIEIDDENETVLDYLLKARPIEDIRNEIAGLYSKILETDSEKEKNKYLKQIGTLENKLDYYDQYNSENTLMEIIENMHISEEMLDLKISNLSGGQKSKIAFAALLYSKANILLLDEPTNHLDNNTRDYIINYLKNYKGTVLIISHDVDFLNAVTTSIMHIDKATHKIRVYKGNYDNFIKVLTALNEARDNQIAREEHEIERLREFVLQYSNSSGKRKRIAESREKLLAKKEAERTIKPPSLKKVRINLNVKDDGSRVPVEVNNLTFGYTKDLYNNLSFLVNNKERFLILGENGIGKSTLLKLIMGYLKPKEGSIYFGSKTTIAYYAQEQENLDLEKTVFENAKSDEYLDSEVYAALGNFLFTENEFNKKVKYLSPGERARINLAKVILTRANLIILDEPTNHLDPITQELIAKNFKDYNGTIILVSHNLSFVDSIGINRILLLPSGKIVNYYKDVVEYYSKLNTKN